MNRWMTTLPTPSPRTLAAMACLGAGGYAAHRANHCMWPASRYDPREASKANGSRVGTAVLETHERVHAATTSTKDTTTTKNTKSELELLVDELIQAADIEDTAFTRLPLVPEPLAPVETNMARSLAVPMMPPQAAIELPAVEKGDTVLATSERLTVPRLSEVPTAQRRCFLVTLSPNESTDEESESGEKLCGVLAQQLTELRVPVAKLVLNAQQHPRLLYKYKLATKEKYQKTFPRLFVENVDTGMETVHVSEVHLAKMVKYHTMQQTTATATAKSIPKNFRVDVIFRGVEPNDVASSSAGLEEIHEDVVATLEANLPC